MQFGPLAIHFFPDSQKAPTARVSLYVQRYRQGISWNVDGWRGAFMRYQSGDRVYVLSNLVDNVRNRYRMKNWSNR